MTAPPFTYYGGKTSIAERIVALFPPHDHYVETFAGSLSVLLAKPVSKMETVNDLDQDLMVFWQVLRNQPDALIRAAALTPHSRAEYAAARDCDGTADDVERARRIWVLLTQSRSGTLRPTGWRHFQDPAGSGSSFPRYLSGYVDRMPPAAHRLRGVTLECRPALEVIRDFGAHPNVLLYVDPPYLRSTRRGVGYRHEMGSDAEHTQLAEALHAARATVVLSGYASPLYERLYAGWHSTTLGAHTGNGALGATARTEVLWSNRPFADHLFSAEVAS